MIRYKILNAVDAIYEKRGIKKFVIRCGMKVYTEILMDYQSRGPFASSFGTHAHENYLGHELLVDKYLLPDVWRLTDADATLLYDCRMKAYT